MTWLPTSSKNHAVQSSKTRHSSASGSSSQYFSSGSLDSCNAHIRHPFLGIFTCIPRSFSYETLQLRSPQPRNCIWQLRLPIADLTVSHAVAHSAASESSRLQASSASFRAFSTSEFYRRKTGRWFLVWCARGEGRVPALRTR